MARKDLARFQFISPSHRLPWDGIPCAVYGLLRWEIPCANWQGAICQSTERAARAGQEVFPSFKNAGLCQALRHIYTGSHWKSQLDKQRRYNALYSWPIPRLRYVASLLWRWWETEPELVADLYDFNNPGALSPGCNWLNHSKNPHHCADWYFKIKLLVNLKTRCQLPNAIDLKSIHSLTVISPSGSIRYPRSRPDASWMQDTSCFRVNSRFNFGKPFPPAPGRENGFSFPSAVTTIMKSAEEGKSV